MSVHVHQLEDHCESECCKGNDEDSALWTTQSAAFVVILVAVAVAICTENLMRTTDEPIRTTYINKTFSGLVLIPAAGSAAVSLTTVMVSHKNRMDYAIRTIINNILQIALLLTPFLIILGWIIGQP